MDRELPNILYRLANTPYGEELYKYLKTELDSIASTTLLSYGMSDLTTQYNRGRYSVYQELIILMQETPEKDS